MTLFIIMGELIIFFLVYVTGFMFGAHSQKKNESKMSPVCKGNYHSFYFGSKTCQCKKVTAGKLLAQTRKN